MARKSKTPETKPEPTPAQRRAAAIDNLQFNLEFHEQRGRRANRQKIAERVLAIARDLKSKAAELERDLERAQADPDCADWGENIFARLADKTEHAISWLVPNLNIGDLHREARELERDEARYAKAKAELHLLRIMPEAMPCERCGAPVPTMPWAEGQDPGKPVVCPACNAKAQAVVVAEVAERVAHEFAVKPLAREVALTSPFLVAWNAALYRAAWSVSKSDMIGGEGYLYYRHPARPEEIRLHSNSGIQAGDEHLGYGKLGWMRLAERFGLESEPKA